MSASQSCRAFVKKKRNNNFPMIGKPCPAGEPERRGRAAAVSAGGAFRGSRQGTAVDWERSPCGVPDGTAFLRFLKRAKPRAQNWQGQGNPHGRSDPTTTEIGWTSGLARFLPRRRSKHETVTALGKRGEAGGRRGKRGEAGLPPGKGVRLLRSKRREENPPSGWVCFFGGAGESGKNLAPQGSRNGEDAKRQLPAEGCGVFAIARSWNGGWPPELAAEKDASTGEKHQPKGERQRQGMEVPAGNARFANNLLLLYSAIKKTICGRPHSARRRGPQTQQRGHPPLAGGEAQRGARTSETEGGRRSLGSVSARACRC